MPQPSLLCGRIGRVVSMLWLKSRAHKRTLYYHQEQGRPIAAYLDARPAEHQADGPGEPRRLANEAIFTNLAGGEEPEMERSASRQPNSLRCSTPGREGRARHKKNFETWLTGELSGHGVGEPQTLAKRFDGTAPFDHADPPQPRLCRGGRHAAATLVRARSRNGLRSQPPAIKAGGKRQQRLRKPTLKKAHDSCGRPAPVRRRSNWRPSRAR